MVLGGEGEKNRWPEGSMPREVFSAPASHLSHRVVSFSQALGSWRRALDSSGEAAWEQAPPIAQSLVKLPLAEHYVILRRFGIWGNSSGLRQEPRIPVFVLPQTPA